jgi:hypothetical protein
MSGVFREKVTEFHRRYYFGKRPSVNWIKAQIDKGEIAGEKQGGLYFVLVDAHGEPIKSEKPTTGNKAADKLLERWIQSTASRAGA